MVKHLFLNIHSCSYTYHIPLRYSCPIKMNNQMGHFYLKLVQVFLKIRVQKNCVPKHSSCWANIWTGVGTKILWSMLGIWPLHTWTSPTLIFRVGSLKTQNLTIADPLAQYRTYVVSIYDLGFSGGPFTPRPSNALAYTTILDPKVKLVRDLWF